jgi:dihydrofolate synthase/folylpolyglutamate synthase
MKQLAEQAAITDHRQLHIVIGMVKDKEVDKALALLPKQAIYYFTRTQVPRGLPENELAEKAAAENLSGTVWPEVNGALRSAMQHAHADDMIIVCGSVFLVGEVNLPINL